MICEVIIKDKKLQYTKLYPWLEETFPSAGPKSTMLNKIGGYFIAFYGGLLIDFWQILLICLFFIN